MTASGSGLWLRLPRKPLCTFSVLTSAPADCQAHEHFVALPDRNWQKFHTPRNICLALMGEAGELSELFQFKGEDTCCQGLPAWSRDDRDKLSQV